VRKGQASTPFTTSMWRSQCTTPQRSKCKLLLLTRPVLQATLDYALIKNNLGEAKTREASLRSEAMAGSPNLHQQREFTILVDRLSYLKTQTLTTTLIWKAEHQLLRSTVKTINTDKRLPSNLSYRVNHLTIKNKGRTCLMAQVGLSSVLTRLTGTKIKRMCCRK